VCFSACLTHEDLQLKRLFKPWEIITVSGILRPFNWLTCDFVGARGLIRFVWRQSFAWFRIGGSRLLFVSTSDCTSPLDQSRAWSPLGHWRVTDEVSTTVRRLPVSYVCVLFRTRLKNRRQWQKLSKMKMTVDINQCPKAAEKMTWLISSATTLHEKWPCTRKGLPRRCPRKSKAACGHAHVFSAFKIRSLNDDDDDAVGYSKDPFQRWVPWLELLLIRCPSRYNTRPTKFELLKIPTLFDQKAKNHSIQSSAFAISVWLFPGINGMDALIW
jgi:hypothetical protein